MTWPVSIFSFHGRANRLQWWASSLLLSAYFWIGAALVVSPQWWAAGPDGALAMLAYLSWTVGFTVLASAVYFGLALNAKRWHDLDRSGWWNLATLIPLVNLWLAVELAFFEGTNGPNRYGIAAGDDDLESAAENVLRVIAWAGILALVTGGLVWLSVVITGRT